MGNRAKGEGSIGKRADGTYYATVQFEGKRKWVYGKTQKEVRAKLKELVERATNGADLNAGSVTVGDFLDRWMTEIVERRNKSKTVSGYRRIIDNHLRPRVGKVSLCNLKPERVQGLLNELEREGRKPRTLRNVRAVLRRALNVALKWGYVSRNVAALVELPRIEPYRVEPLTVEEVRTFLASVKGHPREALYVLAFNLGLREGELLALQRDDLSLDPPTLRVSGTIVYLQGKLTRELPKTAASYRTLPLPAAVLPCLRDHLQRLSQEATYVFGEDSGPFAPYRLLYEFRGLLKAAGLRRVRFHDARHTAATLLIAAGENVRTVASILGHANTSTTLNTYAHAVEAQTQGAVDRLGERLL